MAKSSGLGMRFFLDGYDIAGDVQSLAIRGGPAVLDMTGIDVEAFERKGGLRDGAIDATTYYNPGALELAVPLVDTGSHYLLRAMSLSDRIVSAWHPSGDAANIVAKQGSYDPVRGTDGSLIANITTAANGYGLEWTDQLTVGKVSITGAGAQTSVDFAAATAFGAQAWLHVFEFTGTDATIAVQSSSDNGVGDAWANVTDLVFDEITTSPQAQRKQTARDASIERYLRVNVATTGGFDSMTFAVFTTKNKILTSF